MFIPPRPETRSTPRCDIYKDGVLYAKEQYLSTVALFCLLMSELKPEHNWSCSEPYPVEPEIMDGEFSHE